MPGLSRKVAERIARRAAVDRIVVVVFGKNRLARVFGFEEYLKMKELPRKSEALGTQSSSWGCGSAWGGPRESSFVART